MKDRDRGCTDARRGERRGAAERLVSGARRSRTSTTSSPRSTSVNRAWRSSARRRHRRRRHPRAAPPPPATPATPAQAAERPAPRVMDSLDLGTTSITGNAELPKVLYIVPWKKSDLGDLVGRPVNTLLDEVLAPVDPAVFERHLSYYDSLYGEREEE